MILWRAGVFVLDVLLVCVAGAIVAIAITGGGSIVLGNQTITAHSLRNPFVWFACLLALRLLVRRVAPFLAVRAWDVSDADRLALRGVDALVARLSNVRAADVWRICAIVSFLVLGVRLFLAWHHPGFFSGDDVEVQEMSFARVFGWEWRAWDLRSPFFPMMVIYPVQAAIHAVGVSDPGSLIFAGRASVAVLATLALPILASSLLRFSAPVALLSMLALAWSSVWLHFGSTELPRPLSAALVLAAYCALTRNGTRSAVFAAATRSALLAGAALGIAACLRFSEVMFVAAVACQLILEKRYRDLMVTVLASLTTAVAIQGVSDSLYWGSAFHSLNAIVDYTLVQRLSSRGYEPWWYYAAEIGAWTDWVVVGLACWGARQQWRPALWVLIPVMLLSVLPHHEPRYLIPVLPFVAILAATGLWDVCQRLQRSGAGFAAIGIATLVFGSAAYQWSLEPVPRHDAAVRLAGSLEQEIGADLILIEEPWRWGSHLYLGGGARLEDLTTQGHDSGAFLRTEIPSRGGEWIALRRDSCARLQCAPILASLGYSLRSAGAGEAHDYIVFRRMR